MIKRTTLIITLQIQCCVGEFSILTVVVAVTLPPTTTLLQTNHKPVAGSLAVNKKPMQP